MLDEDQSQKNVGATAKGYVLPVENKIQLILLTMMEVYL